MIRNDAVRSFVRGVRTGGALALLGAFASAQCGFTWLPNDGVPGVRGAVDALCQWDPDGVGPVSPLVVIAGEFGIAGDRFARRIATWDPIASQWAALGTGLGGAVRAVVATPVGEVFAGGAFVEAGGVACSRVARWNGSVWSPLGTGTNDDVNALLALPNGDVVAGGRFTTAGGVVAAHVAVWDGGQWSAMAGGITAEVRDLVRLANGDVVATTATEVWRWNGTQWSVLGRAFAG